MNETPAEIAEILADLRTRHRDLDDALHRLSESPTIDQLRLTRLKKAKLHLKDQIAWWESRSIPDLDA
ncbi:MAG: YdcH family protein [Wenzhouxiangellaceae bacterium]|nr:YdcH family protein [Wenzhouxiangellaceae bacterium]